MLRKASGALPQPQALPSFTAYESIFAFPVDLRAPSILRSSAEWVGNQQYSGLHNLRKCSKLILTAIRHGQELPATAKQRFELAGINRTEHKIEERITTRGAGVQG
jgi:hypothetical protein